MNGYGKVLLLIVIFGLLLNVACVPQGTNYIPPQERVQPTASPNPMATPDPTDCTTSGYGATKTEGGITLQCNNQLRWIAQSSLDPMDCSAYQAGATVENSGVTYQCSANRYWRAIAPATVTPIWIPPQPQNPEVQINWLIEHQPDGAPVYLYGPILATTTATSYAGVWQDDVIAFIIIAGIGTFIVVRNAVQNAMMLNSALDTVSWADNVYATSSATFSSPPVDLRQSIWNGEESVANISDLQVSAIFGAYYATELAAQLNLPPVTTAPGGGLDNVSMSTIAADGTMIPLPEWDPELPGFSHAGVSRGSILRVLLVYEAIRHTADKLYCSPAALRCIVATTDPVIGIMAAIFNVSDAVNPVITSPVTVIFNGNVGADLRLVRLSSCASWQILPLPALHEAHYEPKPVGMGTCLEKGNINPILRVSP
jgi:hypothetical protein